MANYFLAGVSTATLFDGDNLVGVAKTLINNSFDLSLQQEQIRGGEGAGLLALYSHSATLNVTIENALFNLDYIKLQTGGAIKVGTDYLGCEVVRCTAVGEITVSNTPLKFYNTQFICGWLEDGTVVEFNGKVAKSSLFELDKYYQIRYYYNIPSGREVIVPSSIIPSIITAVFDIPLYFTETDIQGLKKVGKLQIRIPKLQLDGNINMNMSMTGYTTSTLSGTALMYSENECDGGKLMTISEDIKYEVLRTLDDIDDLTLGDLDAFKDIGEVDTKLVPETKMPNKDIGSNVAPLSSLMVEINSLPDTSEIKTLGRRIGVQEKLYISKG